MPYAINLGDLVTPENKIMYQFLIAPTLIRRPVIVDAEPGKVDGGAVRLQCDDERAQAIIHIIRVKHPCKNLLRCYESKTGKSWKRV